MGLDRDSPSAVKVTATLPDGRTTERRLTVAPGGFDIQRINGLPPQQVKPQGEALLAKIAAESERKATGWASRVETDDI